MDEEINGEKVPTENPNPNPPEVKEEYVEFPTPPIEEKKEVKEELTHEEKVNLLNKDIQRLKEKKELGALIQERNKINKEIQSQYIQGAKEQIAPVAQMLGGLFKGIQPLGTDLQPIQPRENKKNIVV